MILGFVYLPVVISEESTIFQNISIQSDQVTIDQDTRQLTFKNNLRIKIDSHIIKGSDARLSHKDEKSEKFVIYPNKSMSLLGNAKLINQGNSITSNLITYQITSNE
jgi:lipopolysaccharide export system protein LptA